MSVGQGTTAGGPCEGLPQEYEVGFYIIFKQAYKEGEGVTVRVRASLYRKESKNPYRFIEPLFTVISEPIELRRLEYGFGEFKEKACEVFMKLLQAKEFAEENGLREEYLDEETLENRIVELEDRIARIEDRVDELESERG
jgi:hypothetical protein